LVALRVLQEYLSKSLISAKIPVQCVSCLQTHAFLIFSLLGNIVLSARNKKRKN